MKLVILFSLAGISVLPVNPQLTVSAKTIAQSSFISAATNSHETNTVSFNGGQEQHKMPAVVFRSQEYCRAEVKDFEFETQFKVVGATVYFTGPNYKGVEKGSIVSNSLKPLNNLMERCLPGTLVIFDNVKVIGPDKLVRTIQSARFLLH